MKSSMENIIELLTKAVTDTTTSDGKSAIADEIESEMDTIFSLANTKIDGQYLFSGKSTTVQPFVKDATTGKITYAATDDNKTVNVENNNYAKIVKDINDMLKKIHEIKWTIPARYAFD